MAKTNVPAPDKTEVPDGYVLAITYAKQRGVSRNAIIKAIEEGRITSFLKINNKFFVDPVAASQELARNNSHVGGDTRKRVKVQDSDVDHEEEVADNSTIHALRRRKLEIENAIKIQELRKITGAVIDKSHVESRLFQIGQMFRINMQQLPAEIVDAVMSAKTRTAAILVIEDAVNNALNLLADEIEKGI